VEDLMTDSKSPEIGRSIAAAGIETNYLREGEGPPVLLLHGSGPGVTAYANWRLVIPKLAQRFTAIAPDVVGFGFTERPKGFAYTLDTWCDHIIGFLDALGLRQVHVIGNSFGGALALALADRCPERVDRLVLMGSVGVEFELTAGLDACWGYEPSLEAMDRLIGFFAYDRKLITPDLVKSRLDASVRPGFQETFGKLFPAPRQRHIKTLSLPEDKLHALPHETLIVHGRDDQVIPLAVSLKLHQLLTRSQLHVFGECGHWTQIEKADRFTRLVLDFLSEVPAVR
jgi:pimeloyl-ACP methyl ester carboxylesterase